MTSSRMFGLNGISAYIVPTMMDKVLVSKSMILSTTLACLLVLLYDITVAIVPNEFRVLNDSWAQHCESDKVKTSVLLCIAFFCFEFILFTCEVNIFTVCSHHSL
jgi:hypothetical protein